MVTNAELRVSNLLDLMRNDETNDNLSLLGNGISYPNVSLKIKQLDDVNFFRLYNCLNTEIEFSDKTSLIYTPILNRNDNNADRQQYGSLLLTQMNNIINNLKILKKLFDNSLNLSPRPSYLAFLTNAMSGGKKGTKKGSKKGTKKGSKKGTKKGSKKGTKKITKK
jgi:hypothetical protein